jgi:hypothetical protein
MTEFPNAEENYKVIEKLLAEPENKKCADCTASSADGYICLDFGTFVCFHCAEILRANGHKVKKISPNNIRDEDLAIVKANGNRISYDKWLVRYTGDHPEPNNIHDRKYRQEYLKLKYEEKKWARHDAAPYVVEYAEITVETRNRSTSSPPAFAAPINPFTAQPVLYAPSPPVAHVHIMQQQQMLAQQQLLANQQHLQQQHIQQQLLQQQLQQQQAMLNQQYMQQQQQQMMLQQQQLPPQALQQSLSNPTLGSHLTQPNEVRTRSPSLTTPPVGYAAGGTRSPPPVVVPVLSPRGVSPVPNGAGTPTGHVSPRPVSPFDGQQGVAATGRQRANSKIGVCPQCGLGVDSREMGKHKLKECAYRTTASAQ